MMIEILKICSEICEVPETKIVGKDRMKKIVIARQLYSYILREHFYYGLVEIGKSINRDHSTVLHSVRLVATMLEIDEPMWVMPYQQIMDRIRDESKTEVKLHITLNGMITPNVIIQDLQNRFDCSIKVIY